MLNSFRSRVIGAGWAIRSKGGINGVEVGHKFGAVAGTELGKAGSVVSRKCSFRGIYFWRGMAKDGIWI